MTQHTVLSSPALKQQYLENTCKGSLSEASCTRVLAWGGDLVTYYTALQPGVSR